jgi:hypothetical protein
MLNKNLIIYLVLFHCFIIGISNYLVQFPISLLSYNFTIATFTFPFIVLATDLTVRLLGASPARKVIAYAFIPAFFISLYFADFRIAIASVAAYAFGQLLDIFVFSKIRTAVNDDGLKIGNYWYVAPIISTFFAQLIDTYLFYGLAFYNSADEFMKNNWINIATNDFGFKLFVCYIAFLPIYLIVLNRLFFLIKRK